MIKKFLQLIVLVLLALIIVMLYRTFMKKSVQPVGERMDLIDLNEQEIASRLSNAIKFKTISEPSQYDSSSFNGFQTFLQNSYPLVFENMQVQIFGNHSLVFKWQGTDDTAKPILFLGHQDVVPIEEESESEWEQKPFAGFNDGEFVWGRGSIDDKATVLGLLEASTYLIQNNFSPRRTIYFAFGEDEETMGHNGAKNIAQHFKDQQMDFFAICDEGTFLTKNIVPGISDKPVALISIAEKGYVSLELSSHLDGGHSSMPSEENAITVLSNAISKLQENPFPYELSEPLKGFFNYLGPEMSFVNRLAFSNPEILKPLIVSAYSKLSSGKAMIQTTMTPTIFDAGIKDNVVPTVAKTTINLRILPGHTSTEILDYIKNVLDDDRIEINAIEIHEPSPVSEFGNKAFNELSLAIKDVYPDALVAPSLMIAATDSKYYTGLSKNLYKFMPVLFESEDLPRFHGINERIGIGNYTKAVQIYAQCIIRWNK